MSRPFRVAYFVSHPIQYQAPMLRHIAARGGIDLTVFFLNGMSLRDYHDPGFGRKVRWDVPLLDGYRHEFLPPRGQRIRRRLETGRFDAVWLHGYTSRTNLRALGIAKLLRMKVFVRGDSQRACHADSPARRWTRRALLPAFFRLPDAFLSEGSRNREYYLAHGVRDSGIFPMPCAVDNDFFQSQSALAAGRREAFRAQLGLASARPVILFASKMQARKGARRLLEAWMRMPGDNRPYLLFVGDGEERPALESLARTHNSDSIRFAGFQNQTELPKYYDLCDVFVLPSEREPWGVAVNEAMNAARPVIVTDQVGCAPDLVADGQNGFVVPVDDLGLLARRLKQITGNAARAREMGDESLRRISRWGFEEDANGLTEALIAKVRR